MAKARLKKKPTFMQNLQANMKNFEKMSTQELVNTTADFLARSGMYVKKTPKYVVATESKLRKKGVIDLKPFFAKSSKREIAKDGSWYVKVPIHIKAREFRTSAVYKRALYEAKSLDAGESTTVSIRDFLKGRTQNTLSSLQYTPKSDNLTISKNETGKRTSYTAIRTISSKSPASSWIVGRKKVNENNTSKTLQKDINNLMKWKAKQLFK